MSLSEKLNKILKKYSDGDKLSAYMKFKKIYLQNNKNVKMLYNLAVMQQELGFYREAEENYIFLIKNSKDIKPRINLYTLYFSKELFNNAINILNEIEVNNPDYYQVHQAKAYAYLKLKNYNASISECKIFIDKYNKNIEVTNILGLCFFYKKEYEEAKKIFKQGLKIDSKNIPLLNSIARLYHETRDSKKAERYFHKALELNPKIFETLNNIAGFYLEEAEYIKANKYYKVALSLNAENATILNNLSKVFLSLNELDNAEIYCKKALKINNKNDEFKKTLSLILLKKEQFDNAWSYFDGRLSLSDFISKNSTLQMVKHKFPKKKFLNDTSRILVLREQGIGDEILYGTMYPDLLNSYKNVSIECDERLLPLFRNSFKKEDSKKFSKLGNYSNKESEIKKFDYVIYAGSLGKYFRKDKNSFPQTSYLKKISSYKDNELETILKTKKDFKKIGISWKSFNNRYAKEKSIELDDMTEIMKDKNSIYFNLQYGNVKNEIHNFSKKNNLKIINLKKLDLFNDFTGITNLLINLDVFITVSNSTAHLAGALGVNTYLIKPVNHASYHYWNYENGKSPWYNSIKIITKDELKNPRLII